MDDHSLQQGVAGGQLPAGQSFIENKLEKAPRTTAHKMATPSWAPLKEAAARSPAPTPVAATKSPGPIIDNKFNFLAIWQSNIYECALDEKKKGKMSLSTVMNVLDKITESKVELSGKAKKHKVIAAVIVFQQTSTNRLNRKEHAR